jgi:hypothetical protein
MCHNILSRTITPWDRWRQNASGNAAYASSASLRSARPGYGFGARAVSAHWHPWDMAASCIGGPGSAASCCLIGINGKWLIQSGLPVEAIGKQFGFPHFKYFGPDIPSGGRSHARGFSPAGPPRPAKPSPAYDAIDQRDAEPIDTDAAA